MAFYIPVGQSTMSMLKALVSHMAPLANISGPLVMVLMNRVLLGHAHVLLGALLQFHCLWDKTTSVSQASLLATDLAFFIQMVIPCGMDRGVVRLVPVASSTHHHGSMYNYLPPRLMTLRSGFATHAEAQ